MSSISFPETAQFVKENPRNRRVTFNYLISIIYVFGGVSSLIYLLSKTIVQPLFGQLTNDRRLYARHALDLLLNLNERLASAVSYVPSVQSLSGPGYVDAQTQTDESSYAPQASHSRKVNFSDDNENGNGHERSLDYSEQLKQVSDELAGLSRRTRVAQVGPVKFTLDELSGEIEALRYNKIGGGTVSSLGAKSEVKPDLIKDIKTEIRSLKGSLLSA